MARDAADQRQTKVLGSPEGTCEPQRGKSGVSWLSRSIVCMAAGSEHSSSLLLEASHARGLRAST
eukprot:4246932-Amphidinium_carterae.1